MGVGGDNGTPEGAIDDSLVIDSEKTSLMRINKEEVVNDEIYVGVMDGVFAGDNDETSLVRNNNETPVGVMDGAWVDNSKVSMGTYILVYRWFWWVIVMEHLLLAMIPW